jgi:hypothetical protein
MVCQRLRICVHSPELDALQHDTTMHRAAELQQAGMACPSSLDATAELWQRCTIQPAKRTALLLRPISWTLWLNFVLHAEQVFTPAGQSPACG